MNKQQIYDYLQENSIWHEITEHKAVYNMAELAEVPCPYPEADAKNLFVRDDKKREKRVNLKAFRKAQGTRNLSFASAEDLLERLALIPGAVTPLGVLNDETRSVQVFLDQDFLQEPGLVGVHPNENTATVWLKTEDLIRIIREHGNEVVTFRCEE